MYQCDIDSFGEEFTNNGVNNNVHDNDNDDENEDKVLMPEQREVFLFSHLNSHLL